MTKRLTYTPLNVKGICHYGPPDSDDDTVMLSLGISPAARCGPAATTGRGITTTGRKRKGYAKSAFERKERRRERRSINANNTSSRRRKTKVVRSEEDSSDKENAGTNHAISTASSDWDWEWDGEATSSPEKEFDFEKGKNEMHEHHSDDLDFSQLLDGVGGSSDFNVDDNDNNDGGDEYAALEYNEDDDEDIELGDSEDDEPVVPSNRLFASTTKKHRVILDDDEEEIQVETSQESAVVDAKKEAVRSKSGKGRKRNKTFDDESSEDEVFLKQTKKELPAAGTRKKPLKNVTRPTPNSSRTRISSALASTSKRSSSTKGHCRGQKGTAMSKKNRKTNPSKSKKVSPNKRSDSSGISVYSKSSSLMNSLVRAAEEALVATDATESLVAKDKKGAKRSSKKHHAEKKTPANRKKSPFEFEEEEEDTAVGSNDEASEYEPTQDEGQKSQVIERMVPRSSRRFSSRISKGKSMIDTQRSPEAQTGVTTAVAPRMRSKSGQHKRARGSKKHEDAFTTNEVQAKLPKPDIRKKEKNKILEDNIVGISGVGNEVLSNKMKSRSMKNRPPSINSNKKQRSLDFEYVASPGGGGEGSKVKNERKKNKPSKISKCKKGKEKTMDVYDKDLIGEEEGSEITDHNGNDASNTDDFEVEYHDIDEDDYAETNDDRSMLLTQAAASQFMEQSFNSSTAAADHKTTCVSGIDEVGLRNSNESQKMQSIVLSTRAISKMQPHASKLFEKFVGCNSFVEAKGEKSSPGDSGPSHVPSKNEQREENGSEQSSMTAKSKENNKAKGNFACSIEFATRDIFNVNPDVFLAAIQTQPHIVCRSQQSSAVSPETKACMAADILGATKSQNIESEESRLDDQSADLEENESAKTGNARRSSQCKGIGSSDKINQLQMAQAMKKMGHHVREVGKIWKQVSSHFGVTCNDEDSYA